MKRALLLIYALIVTVTDTLTFSDDFLEEIVDEKRNLTTTQIRICLNKANIRPEDLEKINEFIVFYPYNIESEKSISKIGCFLACIFPVEEEEKETMEHIHADIKLFHRLGLRRSPRLISCRLDSNNNIERKLNDCESAEKYFRCIFQISSRPYGLWW